MKMNKIVALATACLLALPVAGCGSHAKEYTVADCKARLQHDFARSINDPDWAGNKTRPKECANVTNKQAEQIIEEILNDALDG